MSNNCWILLQSQALLGKMHMEALRIKSALNEYLTELHEASALASEQDKQLQVTTAPVFSLLQ